jgi:ATP-dependent Clp protease, protease subunit
MNIYNKLAERNTVSIHGVIDDTFIEKFLLPMEDLVSTEDKNVEHINLWINSPGGDTSWLGKALHLIITSPKPIIAYVDQACSAAFYIAIACHFRFCYPISYFMHHATAFDTSVYGNSKEMDLHSKLLKHTDSVGQDLILKRTNITRTMLKEHEQNTWYMTPEEAKELGVVHDVLPFEYHLVEEKIPKRKKRKKNGVSD